MLSLAPLRSRWITPVATAGPGRGNFCKFRVMGKRKVQVDSDDEVALDVEEEEQEVKPKAKRQSGAKKPKFSEPFVDKLGWNVEPPSLIWRSFGEPEGSKKIAAFDLDSTLVVRKSNSQFARDAADWRWFNKSVPKKLIELMEDGHKLVIFTNQGSIKAALDGKAKEKVEGMVELIYDDLVSKAKDVEVSLQCFMAPAMTPGDSCRKPATGMWQHMVKHCNDGITPDLKKCFFVGDANGVGVAHSDSDKLFAEAVGIDFKTPEDIFGPIEGKAPIDRAAVKAAAEDLADNPNVDLITKLNELGDKAMEAAKGGDVKLVFKGRAYKNAADSLTLFPEKVSESNLKAVNALKGVGKGTMERIKQYLKSGSVLLPGEEEEAAAAGLGAPSKEAITKEQKEAFAFM